MSDWDPIKKTVIAKQKTAEFGIKYKNRVIILIHVKKFKFDVILSVF